MSPSRKLVIVRDFDICKILSIRYKTNSILVINTYAVLPCSVSMQCLKSVSWHRRKILKSVGRIEQIQLSSRWQLNAVKRLDVSIFG